MCKSVTIRLMPDAIYNVYGANGVIGEYDSCDWSLADVRYFAMQWLTNQ